MENLFTKIIHQNISTNEKIFSKSSLSLSLSLSLLGISFSSNAQVKFIPKAGVSYANFIVTSEIPDPLKFEPKLGGAGFEVAINDMFAIQPELVFIQKGGIFTQDLLGTKLELARTLNYLEMPLLVKAKFGTENLKFFVIAGPTISMVLSGSDKLGSDTKDIEFGYNNNQTQRGDFGLQGGLGVMFKGVVIDIRYGYGLANISNTPNNIGTVKNTAISATLGYAIPLGSK